MNGENRRQAIHAIAGSGIIALVVLLGREITLILALLAFAVGLVFSILIKKGLKIPMLHMIVKSVERPNEVMLPGYGALLFFLGFIVVLFFFQNPIVVLGALVVAVYGDAASTLIGRRFGKHHLVKPYTIEGTIGGIIVSGAILLAFVNPIAAIATATIAMLSELLPINDNLGIPVTAAIVLTFLI